MCNIRKIIRKNVATEIFAYLVQNNFFPKWMNRSGGGTIDNYTYEQMAYHCNDVYESYLNHLGSDFELKGKKIIEVGPGRSLGVSLLFTSLGGAERVYAVDRFNCLSHNNELVLKTLVPEYMQYVKKIEYIISPIENLLYREQGKVDLIVSNAVLEHVADLDKTLKSFHSLLSHDGIMVHKIDLRAHNRFLNKGPLYFLKYSDFLWKRMSNHIGAPNRKRLPGYKKLLKRNGFQFEFRTEEYFDMEEVIKAKKTYLKQSQYSDIALSDLSVATCWLIAKPYN
jgi:SAM-dependent methyltransferase